jgi:ribonuclease BN (tRNA processing enzyme)
MRLTVLGGAAAAPNPDQGCSSYLVEAHDTRILLDCGSDTFSTLRAVTDFRSIDLIMVSHVHSDHTLDLVPYRYALRYVPDGGSRRVQLWMPPGGSDFLRSLAAAFAKGDEDRGSFFDVFAIREYDPNRTEQLGQFIIRFHQSHHYIPCWASRLEVDGKSLVYLADTGADETLVEFARGADLLICEGTHLELPEGVSPERMGHLTARQAGELAAAAGVRQLLLTHLWADLGVVNALREAESAFRPVIVAEPKLVIEV